MVCIYKSLTSTTHNVHRRTFNIMQEGAQTRLLAVGHSVDQCTKVVSCQSSMSAGSDATQARLNSNRNLMNQINSNGDIGCNTQL